MSGKHNNKTYVDESSEGEGTTHTDDDSRPMMETAGGSTAGTANSLSDTTARSSSHRGKYIATPTPAATTILAFGSFGGIGVTIPPATASSPPPPPPIAATTVALPPSSHHITSEDNMGREFYRREVLRATTVMLFIAFLCLFFVPIVAILLLPVGLGVVWWLRDSSRFISGGDQTRCFNRNSCLNFYIILLFGTIFINCLDTVFLLIALFSSSSLSRHSATASSSSARGMRLQSRSWGETVTAPPVGVWADDAAYHAAHRTLLVIDLMLNVACGLASAYTLYVCKRLQALLD